MASSIIFWEKQATSETEAKSAVNFFRSIPMSVITIPQRYGQTDGRLAMAIPLCA